MCLNDCKYDIQHGLMQCKNSQEHVVFYGQSRIWVRDHNHGRNGRLETTTWTWKILNMSQKKLKSQHTN